MKQWGVEAKGSEEVGQERALSYEADTDTTGCVVVAAAVLFT